MSLTANEYKSITKAQLATSAGIDVSRIVAIIPLLGACTGSSFDAYVSYNRFGTNDKVDIGSVSAQTVYYAIYVVYK